MKEKKPRRTIKKLLSTSLRNIKHCDDYTMPDGWALHFKYANTTKKYIFYILYHYQMLVMMLLTHIASS